MSRSARRTRSAIAASDSPPVGSACVSVVVEANFFEAAIAALPPHRLVQVHCSAPVGVLLERTTSRGGRHRGHLDARRRDDLAARLRAETHEPLDLPGPVLHVDTGREVDVAAVAARVARRVG
jgi:hypothetical protein